MRFFTQAAHPHPRLGLLAGRSLGMTENISRND
jgi:hypothetical protein